MEMRGTNEKLICEFQGGSTSGNCAHVAGLLIQIIKPQIKNSICFNILNVIQQMVTVGDA